MSVLRLSRGRCVGPAILDYDRFELERWVTSCGTPAAATDPRADLSLGRFQTASHSRLKLTAVVVGLTVGATAALGAQSTVVGTVFDSLRTQALLSGATVVLEELPRYVTTDNRGRFRFDSVPAGTYTITFLHPVLDSIDLAAERRAVLVPTSGTVTAALTVPSIATTYARLCRGPHDPAAGVLLGRVRDVDSDASIAGAIVTAAWTEYALEQGKMSGHLVRTNAITSAAGVYVLCNLPDDATTDVHALANGAAAGPVPVATGARRMARQNFSLSRADSAARLTPNELADTTRQQRPVATLGGTASVTGTVRTKTGERLPIAVVTLLGASGEIRVDSLGRFLVPRVPAGTRAIEVRSLGLAPTTILVDLKAGARLDTTVMLDAAAQSLAEVAVLGQKLDRADRSGFDERKHMGIGVFLTDEDIAKRPSTEIGTILSRVGSLHLNVTGAGWLILMRGGNSMGGGRGAASNLCVPSFFLDGQPVSLQDIRTFVRTPDIKGIEVYTAAERIPAPFDRSSRTACGSVVIWSK